MSLSAIPFLFIVFTYVKFNEANSFSADETRQFPYKETVENKFMVYAPVGEPAHLSRLSQNENAKIQALCGYSSIKNPVERITGGYKTFNGQYPWAVSMVSESKKNRCGGALISDRHILTAVHCFYKYDDATLPCTGASFDSKVMDKKKVQIHFGGVCIREESEDDCDEQDTQTANIKKVAIGKRFTETRCMSGDDLAIVELDRKLKITAFVVPICLRSQLNFPEFGFPALGIFGKNVEVSHTISFNKSVRPSPGKLTGLRELGWGQTHKGHSSARLRVVDSVLVVASCERNLLRATSSYGPYGETRRGICVGDSGGPSQVMTDNGRAVLMGIHSYGTNCSVKAQGFLSIFSSVYVPCMLDDICELTGVCPTISH